jgi:actin-like ATPase involved in cell morphogenesis
MRMADIGIDLGTTNSVLAHLRGGPEVINIQGRSILPSAVAYEDGEWLVGAAAKNLAATKDYVVTSPKRGMGTDAKYDIDGRSYTPVDMSALILKEIKRAAEEFLGEEVTSAIITVPAHFNYQQVEDTKKAAEKAGLKVAKLLPEPVAASATYGFGTDERILVFDLGGGTLDCTVVDIYDSKILGLSGHNFLGGDDFDFRIVDRMLKHLKDKDGIDLTDDKKARSRLKAEAEKYKITLSETKSTEIAFVGKIGGKLVSIDFTLTRKDYNAMIDDLISLAIEKADEAIARADAKAKEGGEDGFSKDDIDVVLLVGGSSMTPYVQERLERHFGKKLSKKVDPMLAVGMGAAACTRDIAWDEKTHRVMVRSADEVWSRPTYNVRGRTTKNSKVSITGGTAPVDTTANAEGKFAAEVALAANAVNDLTVNATAPDGSTAKSVLRIRHDPAAGKVKEAEARPAIQPPLPQNLLLGMKNDRPAILVKSGVTLPYAGKSEDFFCEGSGNTTQRFTLMIPVYEGHDADKEIPVGTLNTHLGTLTIDCPPTPNDEPLVVSYQVDESRMIALKCWFKRDPSISGEIKLKSESISRDKMHLIVRAETTVNSLGERLRPEEKARVNRKKQMLIDLCEQYAGEPTEDLRTQIGTVGKELKEELQTLERKYQM